MSGFTQAQVDALERNIALGVLTVEHNGKRTTFANLSAMMALRDRMKAEIAASAAAPGDPIATPPFMTRPFVFRRT